MGISQLPFRSVGDRNALHRCESAHGISRRAADFAKRFLSRACGDGEPLRARDADGCAGERGEDGSARIPNEESYESAHARCFGVGSKSLWLAAQEKAGRTRI